MSEHQVVVFELADVLYGIDILSVREIIRLVEITPVSGIDIAAEGIINLRGQIIPIRGSARKIP